MDQCRNFRTSTTWRSRTKANGFDGLDAVLIFNKYGDGAVTLRN